MLVSAWLAQSYCFVILQLQQAARHVAAVYNLSQPVTMAPFLAEQVVKQLFRGGLADTLCTQLSFKQDSALQPPTYCISQATNSKAAQAASAMHISHTAAGCRASVSWCQVHARDALTGAFVQQQQQQQQQRALQGIATYSCSAL
jgi:hypothetical protein